MSSERIGGGVGDALALALKYFAQPVFTQIILREGCHVSDADRQILREAAKKVAELAARPQEEEKKRLWYKHNDLQGERPMVVCDPENGWYEIITPDQIQCKGSLARVMEFVLRKTIFWGEEMQDDTVITPIFRAHHVFEETPRGVEKHDIGKSADGAYAWKPAIETPEDVDRLIPSRFVLHEKETREYFEMCKDVFDGILEVRLDTNWWNSCGMTADLIFLIGMENMCLMFYDDPDLLHRLMAFLRDELLAKFEFVEKNGLLCLNNNDLYVGTGGYGWTHELPREGYRGVPRLMDIWGLSESQETIGVSPEMFGEFIFPYQLTLQEKFGLNCYGCCEPVDLRWDYIKQIPRLRRISVSPWSNEPLMAEHLGRDYIYSRKTPPTWLAVAHADEEAMEKGIENTVRLAGKGNLELIMKDTHTIANNPQNCIQYVRVCRRVIDRMV